MTTHTTVVIYHNEARGHFGGYDPAANSMAPVFTYATPATEPLTELQARSIAADAFEAFNIGVRTIAQQYRALRLRSLSAGDVVRVGNHWLAIERVGWKPIDPDTMTLVPRSDWYNALDEDEAVR